MGLDNVGQARGFLAGAKRIQRKIAGGNVSNSIGFARPGRDPNIISKRNVLGDNTGMDATAARVLTQGVLCQLCLLQLECGVPNLLGAEFMPMDAIAVPSPCLRDSLYHPKVLPRCRDLSSNFPVHIFLPYTSFALRVATATALTLSALQTFRLRRGGNDEKL